MQTKSLKKVLSTLLATAMFASIVTVPVFAAGTAVGRLTNSALTDNTIYHEGMAMGTGNLADYSQGTLGGNWYDSLIDTAGVTVAEGVDGVTVSGNDKAFTVNVPIKFAADTIINVSSTGDAAAAWNELKLFQKMPNAKKQVALGFQMAIPTTIGSDSIDFSKSTMTRNDTAANDMFYLNDSDANRASIALNTAVVPANAKAVVMYTNVAEADKDTTGGSIAPEAYTIKDLAGDTQRTYVYTFNKSDASKLATYTVKFNVTFAATPATPLTKDNIAHDGVNGSISGIVAGTNGEVLVTGEDDPTGYIGINLKSLITNDILGAAATTTFEGKRVIDSAAETTMNVYELKTYDANDANCKWVKFGDNTSAEVSNASAIAGGQIFYYPANKISAGAPAAFITYVNAGKKYSYTFTGNDGSKYTLKLDVKADASTPAPAKKPIEFAVNEPFAGGQADGSAQLASSFGFGVRTESDGVVVTGSTIASKIDDAATAQGNTANPAFVVYYKTNLLGDKTDTTGTKYVKYRYLRNGQEVIAASAGDIDDAVFAMKNDSGNGTSTFKMGISLFGKVGSNWAMKYNAPFTDKLELLNKDNQVIAEVSHTFDFSRAFIDGVDNSDIVTDPAPVQGVPPTTLPDKEAVVGAMIGAKDKDGNAIAPANVTAIKLDVKTAPTDSAIATAISGANLTGKTAPVSLEIDLIATITGTGDKKLGQLGAPITIEMDIPASLRGYSKITVFHKKASGTVEQIPATIRGNKFSFVMNSFSPISAVGHNPTGGGSVTPPVTPPTTPNYPNYGFGGYGGGWYTPANTYAVSYNTLGGSSVATTYVNAGSVLTLPTAPTRDGYVFSGWYFDAACTKQVPGEYRPSGAVTLYAFWQSNTPVVAPTNPTAPTTPTTPTTVPQTGDASAVPFVALLFVAAAAIVVIMVPKKKFGTK